MCATVSLSTIWNMVLFLLDEVVDRATHVAVRVLDEPLRMRGGFVLGHVGLETLTQAVERGLALEGRQICAEHEATRCNDLVRKWAAREEGFDDQLLKHSKAGGVVATHDSDHFM